MLFVGVLLLCNAGPVYRHVLGGSRTVPDWAMFHTKGIGGCAVRYLRFEGEQFIPVDGLRAMGYARRQDAPIAWRRPPDERAARALGEHACRSLGRDVDVRLDVRCATPEGWTRPIRPEERLCHR